jgi:hypothetical protein
MPTDVDRNVLPPDGTMTHAYDFPGDIDSKLKIYLSKPSRMLMILSAAGDRRQAS